MRVPRPWQVTPPDPATAAPLVRSASVSPLVAQLLVNRGLTTPATAERWLAAPSSDLPGVDGVPGAVEAGRTLADAARGGAKICVYGDYDVDGTTGSSTLARTLRRLGADVTVYIPHRLEEGYGLNGTAVERIARAGHTHLVTVDCGITSVAEIAVARAKGLTAIVTDHHQPKSELPQDATLVHPGLPGRTAAAPNLCGSAVAWTVARATVRAYREFNDPHEEGFLFADLQAILRDGMALAAIGTVADVVPLVAENRVLVRHGLSQLMRSEDHGLAALLEVCDLKGKILAEDIGFKLGPRINAAGRLGAAGRVIDLLNGRQTPESAARLAEYLDRSNQTRQGIERKILGDAREQGATQVEAGCGGLVVSSADWHPGVIGIVASRLVERFGRPALIVSFGTRSGLGYGSGRSIPGLALNEALQACTQHLVSHGGHPMAAGFKVTRENLPALQRSFWAYCESRYGGPPPPPPLVVEARVKVSDLTLDVLTELAKLEPHGAANPRPYFLLPACRVESAKLIGERQDHVSVTVSHPGPGNGHRIRCVGFGMGERLNEFRGFVDVVGVPRVNEWLGRKSVELEIKDVRRAGS